MVESRYAALSRSELATLVPELLLIGQLIDRSGMAWCISAFGREEMAQIAIEEWSGASPVYTRRMQDALGFGAQEVGHGDVVTIFKGLQLDIGAPPQFMDFRYTVFDPWHGEFHLDHCGALMDVEPMGEDYVRSMCHDIEDPTFDATAVATNARAQVRPVHRPPRLPDAVMAQSRPHCRWTVTIDESSPEVEPLPAYYDVVGSRAASVELDPVDPSDEGMADYAGPLLSDLEFGAFSHSALVRIADEVCLQMHLLNLSFVLAVRKRAPSAERNSSSVELVETICRKQLVGIAGIAAERIHRALGLPADAAGAMRVLELHPLLNPAAYNAATFGDLSVSVAPSAAYDDGGWVTLCGPDDPGPLQAIVRAVDRYLDVEVVSTSSTSQGGSTSEGAWTADVVRRTSPAHEPDEVSVTRFSAGSSFEFEPRRSLPTTPV